MIANLFSFSSCAIYFFLTDIFLVLNSYNLFKSTRLVIVMISDYDFLLEIIVSYQINSFAVSNVIHELLICVEYQCIR